MYKYDKLVKIRRNSILNEEIYSADYFTVEIDGIQTDRFFSCEGLEIDTNVYEVEEGGYNTSTHKRIGHTRTPNIILKKGINGNSELINWFHSNNTAKKLNRKTLSVILMNSAHEEIRRWDLYRAFPVRWKVQTLDANDNSFLIETIEIAHG